MAVNFDLPERKDETLLVVLVVLWFGHFLDSGRWLTMFIGQRRQTLWTVILRRRNELNTSVRQSSNEIKKRPKLQNILTTGTRFWRSGSLERRDDSGSPSTGHWNQAKSQRQHPTGATATVSACEYSRDLRTCGCHHHSAQLLSSPFLKLRFIWDCHFDYYSHVAASIPDLVLLSSMKGLRSLVIF